MNNKVTKVSHIWSQDDDRWVYIEYDEQAKIIGMNFMQGDEYELFKRVYCENNEHLFKFYEVMLDTFTIDKASVNTIEFINKCMWAFHQCWENFDVLDIKGEGACYTTNTKTK